MPLSFSQLLALAIEIEDEVIPAANSAVRVGGFLAKLTRSATMPYDPTAEYDPGQYVLYADAVYRTLGAVAIGESPSVVPTKWRLLTGRDTLDVVAKRGDINTAGKTDQLLEFLGGLILGGIETTTNQDFPALVLNPENRKVYLRGGAPVIEPEPNIVIEEQYEELPTVGVGIFRIIDAAHSSSLTIGEAGSLQLQVEEQQNDETWLVILVGRTWSMVSQPTDASISTTGLLNIAANSVSSNSSMGVRAALTGGTTVVETTVLITNAPDADSVDVSAPSVDWQADPAIDVTITSAGGSNYTVDFTLRCPSDWQYRFNSFPTWNNLSALSGGYDSSGYLYGTGIGPIANGSSVIFHVKKSNGDLIDLTVNVTGSAARTTIYP